MFERLKAIWKLPEKLELKEDRLKSYADMCQDCAEKNIRQRFEQHKKDIRSMIKAFSKTLTELREMVHPDHAKVQNFSERIASLEEQISVTPEDTGEFVKVDIQTIMGILQTQIEADRLIRSQRNFTNRLLRLLRTTTEDPGKSITEDLRKAEKWNKTLRRKLRSWKERSEYRENQEAVNEG